MRRRELEMGSRTFVWVAAVVFCVQHLIYDRPAQP